MKKTSSSSINHITRIIKEISVINNSMGTFNINELLASEEGDEN